MTPTSPPTDLRALTALRFLAAMWVALYAFWPNLDLAIMPNLIAKGYLGVELFFVLSGFILCHVYLAQVGARLDDAVFGKRFDYPTFLWARIARVYPLHLATLLAVIVLGLGAAAAGFQISGNVLHWPSLAANIGMVHAWGLAPEAAFNHRSWSISAEWFAYLLFPAFAVLAWKARNRPVVATAVTAVFLAGLYVVFERLADFALTEATIRWGALRIVPCFAYGCALYLLFRRAPLKAPGLVSGAAALLLIGAASLQMADAVIVILAGALILGLASLDNARAGLLASAPAVYLGEISYSVYMVVVPWQLLSVNLAAKLTGAADDKLQLFVWLAIVAAVPVIAALSYYLVEHPARRALRRWAEPKTVRPRRDESARQLA